ncbi:MAG TPA: acyl-CoA dehydrogenase [Polyangiaceae bacterium]|nr:acyl-CoA dehydrogenase [Polyangiaceae bacterium]
MTCRNAQALALGEKLGDPFDASAPLSHEQSMRWDEAEHFPREGLDILQSAGAWRAFVPSALGGDLGGYDELLGVARVIASRDLTVAVTASAMIWSTLIWIGGDQRLREQHAASILAGRTPCLAYSEESHGADLLMNDTIASPCAGGYLVSGKKWPINRATTGDSVVLLARSGERNDPRGSSLFWFEKSSLAAGSFRSLPRAATLGVRGCDISGIEFDGAFVPASQRLGAEGAGLELALKGFHVTRTLCAGLSLGAIDAALRTTLRLVQTRRLYGNAVLALPQVRWTMVESYALLRALDAASLAATRLLHVSPEQSALISAVVKHAIPAVAEQIASRLATIHGARFFLRDHHDHGLMQKIYRDNLLISIFDGSSPINLHALGSQLSVNARFGSEAAGRRPDPARARAERERAALACSIDEPPPPFDPSRLELVSRGADDIIGSLGQLIQELDERLLRDACGARLLAQLGELRAAVREVLVRFEPSAEGPQRSSSMAPARAAGAARYALLYVAAAAAQVWWRSHGAHTLRAEPWLVVALAGLLGEGLAVTAPAEAESFAQALLPELLEGSSRPDGYHYAHTKKARTA